MPRRNKNLRARDEVEMLDVPRDSEVRKASAGARLAAPLSEPRWSVRTLLAVIRWRVREILAGLAIGMLAASIYVILAPARYTATSVVALATKRSALSPTERAPETLVDTAVVDSELEALRSEKVALATIDKLDLWRDPEFVDLTPSPVEALLRYAGLSKANPPPSDLIRKQIALGKFKASLDVERSGRSYVAVIAFTSLDPKRAAAAANGIAEAYIAEQIQSRLAAAKRATSWMEERITELGTRAADAAGDVETFKSKQNLIVDAKGKLASEIELSELSSALAKARAEAADAEAKHQRMRDVVEARGASNDTYKMALDIARGREDALEKRISDVFQRNASSRSDLVQMQDLEARAQTYRSIHDAFLGQYTQAVQLHSFPTTDARILTAPAAPLAKSHPKTSVILFLAFAAGIGLGGASAFGREYFARPIRSSDQLSNELDLRCIGEIPLTGRRRALASWKYRILKLVGSANASTRRARGVSIERTTEVFRSIRLALADGTSPSRSQVIGIFSPRLGEGKTTIAYNLAVLTASTGQRALLIESDVRHPSLSRSLKFAAPGLQAVLVGSARLADAVKPHREGFDILGLETTVANFDPTIAFGSSMMLATLEEARGNYDYIIVDTPGLLEHPDARAFGHFLDSVVLVAEWGRTSAADLHHARWSSDAIANRVVGVVLNKTPKRRS